jgi:hypothetical protein
LSAYAAEEKKRFSWDILLERIDSVAFGNSK